MFCQDCGIEIVEGQTFCTNCGAKILYNSYFKQRYEERQRNYYNSNRGSYYSSERPTYQGSYEPRVKSPSELMQAPVPRYYSAIMLFMVLGSLIESAGIVPVFWCIPACGYASKTMRENKKLPTWFKVFTLLFVSRLAGILMLLDQEC